MSNSIRQCEYCGIDFEIDASARGNSLRAKYCKTKSCKRDRMFEWQDRYYAKVPKKPGYLKRQGNDVTEISANAHLRAPRRKRREQ